MRSWYVGLLDGVLRCWVPLFQSSVELPAEVLPLFFKMAATIFRKTEMKAFE